MKSTTAATVFKPLLDINGVAARLNISVRHVRRLVAEKRIPYLKVGNLLRFSPDEIEAWVDGLVVCRAAPDPADGGAPRGESSRGRMTNRRSRT